jgi:hypothetical protein
MHSSQSIKPSDLNALAERAVRAAQQQIDEISLVEKSVAVRAALSLRKGKL